MKRCAVLFVVSLSASTALAQQDFSQMHEQMDSFQQQMQIDAQQMQIDAVRSEQQQQSFRNEVTLGELNNQGHGYQSHQSQKSAAELDEETRKSAGISKADWEARKAQNNPFESGFFNRRTNTRSSANTQSNDAASIPPLQDPNSAESKAALDAQDRALRADPMFAPLMDEHDQLRADYQRARDALHQVENDYTERLRPIEQDLRARQNQIAPLQAQVDAYTSRIEELVGMNPAQEGEDASARRNELNNRISQISDPKLAARVQTILNSLEPAAAELRQREAALQPVAEAHEALQTEGERAWQTQHDQFEAELGPRRKDWQQRFQQAHAKERADMAAAELKIAPKQ